MADDALSLAEQVCLALARTGTNHGWAMGSELAPAGPLGRIWTLSRPLTYRAIDQLEAKGHLRRDRSRGTGPGARAPVAATARGRRAVDAWLDAPVEHLRDLRTELLLKLTLRDRAGLDNVGFLEQQRRALGPSLEQLGREPSDATDLVALWRREQARAARRFLDHALSALAGSHGAPAPAHAEHADLRISARNQIPATVTSVRHGEVMSTIHTQLGDGSRVTAAITRDAAEDLLLTPGDDVVVIVKSTEVLIGKR